MGLTEFRPSGPVTTHPLATEIVVTQTPSPPSILRPNPLIHTNNAPYQLRVAPRNSRVSRHSAPTTSFRAHCPRTADRFRTPPATRVPVLRPNSPLYWYFPCKSRKC